MARQSRKVLCFGDIYKQLQALLDSVAEFTEASAESKQLLENSPELNRVRGSLAAIEATAAQLIDAHLDRRCVRCRGKQQSRRESDNCTALARAYLKYRIIDALQPHPAYKTDDGFQPLYIIRGMRFDDDRKGRKALAEFRGRELPVMPIVEELVEKGSIVRTEYEPWNGDVMLGLPENLPLRRAAHEERIRLIARLAEKYRHRAGWNEDGTGWLMSPRKNNAEVRGSVWDLLSYLHAVDFVAAERPAALN